MIFSDNLKKSNILINPKSKTRWELIDEFIDLVVKNKNIPFEFKDEIAEALHEREKSMSTGIGKAVALPHCTSNKIDDLIVSLAISEKGIEFEAIDNVPVQFAILLIVPKNKLNHHIKTLAKIARIMNNEELKSKLLTLKTQDSVLKNIKHFERIIYSNNGTK